MTWAFLSHNWPGGGQHNGIPEDEHWAPHWGGPVSMPGSEGQLRTSLPSDTARAAAKGTWSPQPRGKGQWRSVRASMACWCAQGPSTCVWCSAEGMSLSSWPWRRSLWDGRRKTGLEFVISHTVDWSLVSESFDLKSLALSLWASEGKPKFCETRRSALAQFTRSLVCARFCLVVSKSFSSREPGAVFTGQLCHPWLCQTPGYQNLLSTWVLTFLFFLQWPIYWNAFRNKVKRQKKEKKKKRKIKMEREENYQGN